MRCDRCPGNLIEGLDPTDEEFSSVEALVEWLYDEEAEEFDHRHLLCLNVRLGRPLRALRRELEGYGLRLAKRPKERQARGFQSNPHNRWAGNPCAGGSGWEQITGFAGQEG